MSRESLFDDVCSVDFLQFKFGARGYQEQLFDSIAKTNVLSGVKVELIQLNASQRIVWVTHNFQFLGGSLGSSEGEKITKSFEYGLANDIPVVVQCKTGGARMQEGTSSLMQMAKVSVAVEALHNAGIPFISILNDPTYGGVSASYAMQADVKIAVADARIGFAGPAVILNTMCEANQMKYDTECPSDFQSSQYLFDHGQIDIIVPNEGNVQQSIEKLVGNLISTLSKNSIASQRDTLHQVVVANNTNNDNLANNNDEADRSQVFNYTRSRQIDRPQVQDIINNSDIFTDYIELSGDGRVGRDVCIRGGIALYKGLGCVVLGNYKGHTPQSMQEANYGMASPHGYRFALRLMKLAERFNMPVITLVDTVGAWPTFDCESDGQSEAIATNLTIMAGLTVPIVTIMVGEGGSGGALGICMGNTIGMLSGGYFGVISPEGAASILGRYKDDVHKATQFPLDCQELATAQCIYAYQLKEIGVVDEIIWESVSVAETYKSYPILAKRINNFITSSLLSLLPMNEEEIISHRYKKFRSLGTYSILNESERQAMVTLANGKKSDKPAGSGGKPFSSKLITFLANEIVSGERSRYRKLCPTPCPTAVPVIPASINPVKSVLPDTAKHVLDTQGPAALAQWVLQQSKVLVTDTTMRDAHQSLLATRVRTEDIVKSAMIASDVLRDAFSLECWGGATFDVCMRFLDECPWDRLREMRQACPNILLQMLIRGANAVGYTSYPDNVVEEFIRLSAINGMDVFRIFDCFNIVENMRVSINAVLKYYQSVAYEVCKTGAHIIAIKDMAGLLKPLEVIPLMDALRAGIKDALGDANALPIHFHTHATSSGTIATTIAMAQYGCNIIDFCTASMADGTSQPSLNTFVAMMEGGQGKTDTKINYLSLEPYDMYWSKVRDMYSPFESGMKSGSARVYEHQIPGGQYSNLLVQCQSMGIYDKWEEVLLAYRDVNDLFGDIVKVTPSSKCVGDLALYLVTRNLSTSDLLNGNNKIDFPESVVGLFKGELGLPHRGFPKEIESIILKGSEKLKDRPGLLLKPVDFDENIQTLTAKFNQMITPEQAMSYLMYPKVFSDYMTKQQKTSLLLRYLPTPVYVYSMLPNQSFTMSIPSSLLHQVSKEGVEGSTDNTPVNVTIELKRIGPLQKRTRTITFTINGKEEQSVVVKDTSGVFIFEGPMADTSNSNQMGSPMPGVIEKLLIKEGDSVKAGDTLCTVSAMKMEVKVTAPRDATVASLVIQVGTRVVEGALIVTLK